MAATSSEAIVKGQLKIMGIVYLLLAGCLWGTIGPISKFIFASGFTPLETAFWRGTVAGLFYMVHALSINASSRREAKPLLFYRPHLPGMILFGLFAVATLESSYVIAVQHGGAALASVLLYSAPLWVNALSWKFFREKISARQLTALMLTTLGIVGVSLWGAPVEFSGIGVTAGLISGFSYALFYIVGRVLFQRSSTIVVYAIAFPVASLAILPMIFWLDGFSPLDVVLRFSQLSLSASFALIAVGVFSTYLPYILHGKGLQLVASGKAAIVTMIEPVVAIFLAWLIWNESFSAVGYLCSAVVITGVIMVNRA